MTNTTPDDMITDPPGNITARKASVHRNFTTIVDVWRHYNIHAGTPDKGAAEQVIDKKYPAPVI